MGEFCLQEGTVLTGFVLWRLIGYVLTWPCRLSAMQTAGMQMPPVVLFLVGTLLAVISPYPAVLCLLKKIIIRQLRASRYKFHLYLAKKAY